MVKQDNESGGGPTLLARDLMEYLKARAALGEKLNAEAIAAFLAERPEVIDPASPVDLPENGASRDELQARLTRLASQKQELLDRLDAAEDGACGLEDFMRRALLTAVRLIPQDQPGLASPVEALRQGLIEAVDVEDLEARLQAVKTAVMTTGVNDKPAEPKGGGWKKLFKGGASVPGAIERGGALDRIREAYLELLSEFNFDLDPSYFRKLISLRSRIAQSEDLDYLLSLKSDLIALIKSYTQKVFEDRNEAASFLAQMTKRLSDLEDELITSVTQTDEFRQANADFSVSMTRQIDRVNGSVNESYDLKELKTLVAGKLNAFKKAIEHKRKEDEIRLDKSSQTIDGMRAKLAGVTEEIGRVQEINQQLSDRLTVDPLTGAANRSAYDDRLEAEMERLQRYGRVFSMAVIDIDDFKKINDTYGHLVGDGCLKEVVSRLRSVLRKADFLARYGGEEFVVLMPETTKSQAIQAGEKLRQAIELTEFSYKANKVPVTISIGLTEAEPSDPTGEDVFIRADEAMYQAKLGGKNQVKAA